MKIDPCSITNINLYKSSPVFCSKPDNETVREQTNEIPEVTKDYNTRTPIKYTYTGDIKLQDGIVAKSYKLANGQRVVIVPKSGSTIVKTYVNTGSFNEPDNIRGISHYIEHNLFNGSEEFGDEQFFGEVDKMGASTNASTSFANTDYYIKSNMLYEEDLENKIRLHAGMLTSPKFLTEKLEKEKKIVNSEINMCLSEDENIGFTQTVKNLFNINSTSNDLVAGSTDNITALTREDVVEYFNNNYYPGNMTTVITGEVDPDKTIGLIAKYFNQTKVPTSQRKFEKMIPTEKAVRQDIISEESKGGASSIFIGFSGPENNNTKDYIYMQALSVLASGLYESRFSDIERTFGTGISCGTEKLSSRPSDKSMILFETRISEGNSEHLISDIYKGINNLSQIPPTENELQAVKNALKKDYDLTLETSSGLNSFIGTNLASERIDVLKNYKEIIDKMTAEDIQQTAKKYLDLNKAALTVVHPNGTTSEMIKNNYEQISQTNANNVSFTGAIHKTPINIDEIKTYRTYNNYEVVLNNSNSDTVQYKMSIEKNAWTPRKAATAEVLSDLLKNAGTKNHTIQQLSKEADLYAIDSSISACDYGIRIYADFPVENADKALDLFTERVLSPNFSEKELTASIKRLKDAYSRPDVSPYDKLL
ncbi:insulinase family protein, partial [bacterium]|nr:insulinase family protein [bacterium]